MDPKKQEAQPLLSLSSHRQRHGVTSGMSVYEQNRLQLKFGPFMTTLLFCQTCIGISVYTLHMSMAKVGVFWSFSVSVIIGLATAYGLSLLDLVATLIEKDTERSEE